MRDASCHQTPGREIAVGKRHKPKRGAPKGSGKPDPTKDRSAHEAARGLQLPSLSELSRELPSEEVLGNFIGIVDGESSDRSAAIMAASLVEQALFTAVFCRLADCGEAARNAWFHEANAPFGTFSAKIKLGRALGIYGPQMEKRLEKVKNVRNVFAHRTSPIDFKHPSIEAEINTMMPNAIKTDAARVRYCATCLALARLLVDDSFKNGGKTMPVSYP